MEESCSYLVFELFRSESRRADRLVEGLLFHDGRREFLYGADMQPEEVSRARRRSFGGWSTAAQKRLTSSTMKRESSLDLEKAAICEGSIRRQVQLVDGPALVIANEFESCSLEEAFRALPGIIVSE
jgi:hypothetical protein